MTLRNILLALGGAAALVHVASYILIMAALDRRGYKMNVLLARLYFGKYIKAYRDATVKEAGKPAPCTWSASRPSCGRRPWSLRGPFAARLIAATEGVRSCRNPSV